jgi:hypothetical protein
MQTCSKCSQLQASIENRLMQALVTSHPSPTMCDHPACISAWGRHYTIQAVAFDLLIEFSLIFPRTHGFRSTTIPAVINNDKLLFGV